MFFFAPLVISFVVSFSGLTLYLQKHEVVSASELTAIASPTPTAVSTVAPTPSSTPESSYTPSPTPEETLAPTFTPKPTPKVTASPSVTPKPTPTVTPIVTPTPTATPEVAGLVVPSATPDVWSPGHLEGWFAQYAGQYGVDKNALEIIANCESHFNPNIVSPNGLYVGMFQFSASAWQNYRGQMGMDTNLELRKNAEESIRTAAFMMSKRGTSPWPSCI